MTDHNEAVRLAEGYMDQSGRVALSASQIGALVRAVLAMAPVVAAAGHAVDCFRERETKRRPLPWNDDTRSLVDAIDAYRAHGAER